MFQIHIGDILALRTGISGFLTKITKYRSYQTAVFEPALRLLSNEGYMIES